VTNTEPQPNRRTWLWLLLFAGLVLLRLVLPFRSSDTMLVHSAVVDSLLKGHNWGRQALVGSLQYSLLPTLALLVARLVAAPFGGSGGTLLVAVCQVWSVFYVARLAKTMPRRWAIVAGLVYIGASREIFDAFATTDPNWVLIPLLVAVVYHLALWHEVRDLRDAVLAAADAGLLVFAGPGGIVLAVAIVAGMARYISVASRGPKEEREGLKWLVWTPFCYCLLLLFLWNWLIMDSPFFLFHRLLASLADKTTANVVEAISGVVGFELGWFTLAAMLAAGLCLAPGRPRRTTASAVTVGLLAVVVVRAFLGALALYPAGCGLLLAGGAVCLVGLALSGADWQGHRSRAIAGMVVLLVGIVASRIGASRDLATEAAFAKGAPPAEEITSIIDQYWPNSRIAVYGMREAAIYHDPKEKRFVARIDFHQGLFLDQAKDEVMHFLLPPDNDIYYPRNVGPFSSIHAEGRPWLLLEKTWPSGWQLWRCVVSPERHSHLEGL
jgi:MFS family permease